VHTFTVIYSYIIFHTYLDCGSAVTFDLRDQSILTVRRNQRSHDTLICTNTDVRSALLVCFSSNSFRSSRRTDDSFSLFIFV